MSHPRTGRRRLELLATTFALSLTSLHAGCATQIRYLCWGVAPTNTFVTLESTPPGAMAKLSNGRTVTTPIKIVLRSDGPVSIQFTKDGFQPAEAQVTPGLNGWVFGNLLAFPPFGFFIDAEQSAGTRLYPSTVRVDLVSVAKTETHFDTSIESMTVPGAPN